MIRRYFFPYAWLVFNLSAAQFAIAADSAPTEKYRLDYPIAQQFCPPVESYWDDVSNAIQNIHGRVIKHQYNGGYGLPVIDMVGDQHLLHLGADVSWQRPVAVYAIANGVVRISDRGTVPETNKSSMAAPGNAANGKDAAASGNSKSEESKSNDAKLNGGKSTDAKSPVAAAKKSSPAPAAATQKATAPLGWGNLIVIEHHLPDGTYATSIYGHLANRRLVAAGDVVQAGQVIGTVAKSKLENGGYEPHLHFAVRPGRMIEPSRVLFEVRAEGKPAPVKLVDLNEQEIEVQLPEPVPPNLTIGFRNNRFNVISRDGRYFLPNAALNYAHPRDFPIVGYGLTTDGFADPTLFLRQARADTQPAPFGRFPQLTAKAKP